MFKVRKAQKIVRSTEAADFEAVPDADLASIAGGVLRRRLPDINALARKLPRASEGIPRK